MTIAATIELPALSAVTDDVLLATQRSLADVRRRVDAAAARVAAEIVHRSRPELGYDGLAQRLGARTPALLVQQVTGATARDAGTLVRTGAMLTDTTPWLRCIAAAVGAATLTVDAADAIRTGLGQPSDTVPVAALTVAAETLLVEARTLTPERLAARARDARAELELAEVANREAALHAQRTLTLTRRADGMTRLTALLAPEDAATVWAAYDSATSPRRGGPRFIDPDEAKRAAALTDDTRTTDQLAVDVIVELIRLGTAVAPTALLGKKRPAVTLHVNAADLNAGIGVARFEGQPAPISINTAARMICDLGILPVLFDGGQVVNLGREQRLFTRAQTLALAARDGGCIFPDCQRPPSWAEAHHINQWHRDHGETNIADGVLLCRHHHLLIHNNSWRVTRDRAEYFFIPTPDLDPQQRPIPAQQRALLARAG